LLKLLAISALVAVSVIFGAVRSEAADFWNITGITKTAKVAISLSYNSPAGIKTVSYKPTSFAMKIERKLDSDDAFSPRLYTSVRFGTGNAVFNASMSGSGMKTASTTLFIATVNNDLEADNDAEYPPFSFSDGDNKLDMVSAAMLTTIAEGSFTERGDLIDLTMKYTAMGTVTFNDAEHYPAKISITVNAKGVGGA